MFDKQFVVFAVPVGGVQTVVSLIFTSARPQLLCCNPCTTSVEAVLVKRKQTGAVPVTVCAPELPPEIVCRSLTAAVPQ
jgi:hypothetical protein